MRINRDWFYDFADLLGRAIVTARKRNAGPGWDMDEQIAIFVHKWRLERDPLEKNIREEAQTEEDRYGLFGKSGWRDSAQDGTDSAIDERENRRTFSRWGSEAFEQRKAQRHYDDFGDGIACQLWELIRQVRFKELRLMDAAKELQWLCQKIAGYISAGWARRLAQIIDEASP